MYNFNNYSAGYGSCFERHPENTRSVLPAALRIPCAVCPITSNCCLAQVLAQYLPVLSVQTFGFQPAHTSVYGHSLSLNRLLTLLRLQGQGLYSVASPFNREKRHWRFSLFGLIQAFLTVAFQRCAILAMLEGSGFALHGEPVRAVPMSTGHCFPSASPLA